MRMNKKIMLSLGAATIVVAPIQTIMSLGDKNTTSQNDVAKTEIYAGLVKTPEQAYVDALTFSDIQDTLVKTINLSLSKASVNATLLNEHGPFHIRPHNVLITLTAVGNDNTSLLHLTITSATLGNASRANPSELNGIMSGSIPTNDVAVKELTAGIINLYILNTAHANRLTPDELIRHLNNDVWVISPYSVNVTTHVTKKVHLPNGTTKTIYKVTRAWKGNASLDDAALAALGGDIIYTP